MKVPPNIEFKNAVKNLVYRQVNKGMFRVHNFQYEMLAYLFLVKLSVTPASSGASSGCA